MKRFLILLIAALIFTGCGPEVPDPESTDWCYIYDFTDQFNDFNVVHGEILHLLGFIPDSSNVISFSYEYDRFVEPLYVIPVITRAPGVTGDITIDAAGVVYGVEAAGQAVLPNDVFSASPVFEQTEIGLAGSTINVTIQSSQAIVLRQLEIRGMGSNPFERNDCDKSPYKPTDVPDLDTPSPIPTLTPSLTASPLPTATDTPVNSPTPSNTPSGHYTCVFDFTLDQAGWVNEPRADELPGTGMLNFGTWTSGQGWVADYRTFSSGTTFGALGISTTTPIDTTVTSMSALYSADVTTIQGTTTDFFDLDGTKIYNVSPLSKPEGTNKTISANTNLPRFLSSGDKLWVQMVYRRTFGTTANSGYLYLHKLTIRGDGTAPWSGTGIDCSDPTPTPTISPTPSNTPNDATNTAAAQTATASSATPTAVASSTVTQTPSAGYYCYYDFLSGNGSWISINGTHTGGTGWLGVSASGNTILQLQRSVSSTQIDSMTLTWLVELPAARLTIDSPYGTTSTINVTAGTRIQNIAATKTGVTLLQISAAGGAVFSKRLILQRVEVRGVGSRPTGATCNNPTPTPNASRTPLPSVTPRPSTRTPVPPPPQFITATSGGPTVTPGGPTITPNGTGTAMALTATAAYGTPINQGAGEAGQGFGTGTGIGTGFGNLFMDWLGQAGAGVGALITDFLEAPPEPIPGLPLCMSAPMEHDICAIYYILDYTLLAPGTPGALIVPFSVIAINVYVVIYLLRWVLKIVRRGESVTNVG